MQEYGAADKMEEGSDVTIVCELGCCASWSRPMISVRLRGNELSLKTRNLAGAFEMLTTRGSGLSPLQWLAQCS